MQFRLIHGTIAIIGNRTAVSDLAILTELFLSLGLALFSSTFVEPHSPPIQLTLSESVGPSFLIVSSMLDFGLAIIVAVFVFGIAKGDQLTGARLLFSFFGGFLACSVATYRVFKKDQGGCVINDDGGISPKSIVLVCLEILLGLVFGLDFLRGIYYMRQKINCTHMVFTNFIFTLLTPPSLAILFEIWYFEHPAELLVPIGNFTEVLNGQDRVNAVFVMSATPTQTFANLIVIVGTFLGDKYTWINPLFAMLGALVHVTVGAVFTLEALDSRFRHRHARTTLGAFIAYICGASHLLATIMFSIMREERTVLIIKDDPDIVKYTDKMRANTVIPNVRASKDKRRCPSTIHKDFETHSLVPRYKIWYRRKHLD